MKKLYCMNCGTEIKGGIPNECSCGAEFESGSTAKELRVDTCSNCHPFFTGRQRFAAAAGRIEKFNKRYGKK